MSIEGKIFVCCPGGSVTGGPELLHQLVDALRQLGHDAYIAYYPFEKTHTKPSEYSTYDCPVSSIEDNVSALIVVPEVFTKIAKKVKKARVAIWWLSVDNYYQRKGHSWISDLKMRITTLRRSRILLNKMKHLLHFTQSAYAREFLEKNGISSLMLTDYLATEHLCEKIPYLNRSNIIAYNPKKGVKKTELLIKAYPEIKFVPIRGMTKAQVNELLSTAKIYIDFGLHPGKDRLPREAAMAGCCIITGLSGSAGNNEDISIPRKYKLNDNNQSFIKEFGLLAKSIFSDFEENSNQFKKYRKLIREEPSLFKKQVLEIFGTKV